MIDTAVLWVRAEGAMKSGRWNDALAHLRKLIQVVDRIDFGSDIRRKAVDRRPLAHLDGGGRQPFARFADRLVHPVHRVDRVLQRARVAGCVYRTPGCSKTSR